MKWTVTRILSASLVISLPGCAASPKVPDVVRVPVPIACLTPADIPPRPAIAPDGKLARLDDYDLVRTIAAERAELVGWSAEALALLERCSR